MAVSMKEIYGHIESMRGADKPSSFDDISRFLSEQGFSPDDVQHAITYVRRKEYDEIEQLKEEANPISTFGRMFFGIALLLAGLASLYFAVRVTYISFFTSVPIQDTEYELTTLGHILAIVGFWVGALALPGFSIRLIKRQVSLKKRYQRRKQQGLL